MCKAILTQIRALATIVPFAIAAILLAIASAANADGHHDEYGPFWFNENGQTKLHYLSLSLSDFSRRDILASAQDLLNRGANPNVVDSFDSTPLMNAATTNFIKMASLLIANGAFVNARSNFGFTAMDFAIDKGHTQMQALLRAHGGECNKMC